MNMYSLLEEHADGSWWYHPGCTFSNRPEACDVFMRFIGVASSFELHKGNISRSVKIITHTKPFPQDMSRCTRDFVHFDFAGGYEFNLTDKK